MVFMVSLQQGFLITAFFSPLTINVFLSFLRKPVFYEDLCNTISANFMLNILLKTFNIKKICPNFINTKKRHLNSKIWYVASDIWYVTHEHVTCNMYHMPCNMLYVTNFMQHLSILFLPSLICDALYKMLFITVPIFLA